MSDTTNINQLPDINNISQEDEDNAIHEVLAEIQNENMAQQQGNPQPPVETMQQLPPQPPPSVPQQNQINSENMNSILNNSIFAVSKSGTVSLQISSSNIPSIIIYKLSFINFMIFKMLVNVKFANIINIINNREIIPELLQNECNADEIYKSVIYLLKNPDFIKKQLSDCSKTLEGIRSKTSSSEEACLVLRNYLS